MLMLKPVPKAQLLLAVIKQKYQITSQRWRKPHQLLIMMPVNLTQKSSKLQIKSIMRTKRCHMCLNLHLLPRSHPQKGEQAIIFVIAHYSLSPGFWQSFISIEVCRDCIPALASSCKKQLTGFFVCLLFFLKVKRIS